MAAATACGGSFPDRKRPSGHPQAVKRCDPCRLGAGCAGWSPSGGGSAGWGPVTARPALKGPPVAPQPPEICREKLVFTWQDAQGTPSARDSCTPPAGATELHSCSGNRDPTCAARRGPKMKQTEKDEGHENSEATGRSVPSIALGFPPCVFAQGTGHGQRPGTQLQTHVHSKAGYRDTDQETGHCRSFSGNCQYSCMNC